jgi:hypothetical protein
MIVEFKKPNTELEFRSIKGKDILGTIFEIDISINEYQTNIVYHIIDDLGRARMVDGTTFNEII